MSRRPRSAAAAPRLGMAAVVGALVLACAAGPPPVGRRVDDLVTWHRPALVVGVLTLDAAGVDDPTFQALLADGRVERLHDLRLPGNQLGAASVSALLASPKSQGLRVLDLGGNPVGDAGLQALAGSPRLATVQTLVASEVGATATGAMAIATSPHATALRQLVLSGNDVADSGAIALAELPLGASLALDDARIGAAGARALLTRARAPRVSLAGNPIGGGGLAGLESLSSAVQGVSLARARLGPGDAVVLAGLPAPGLRELDLHGNAIGDEGVRALVGAPWFATLTRLDVRDTGASGATLQGLADAWGARSGLDTGPRALR